MASMVEFAARHGIEPVTEAFPMSKVNDAIEKLRTAKPGHRIVLENDFYKTGIRNNPQNIWLGFLVGVSRDCHFS
jgi:hypothetical protein